MKAIKALYFSNRFFTSLGLIAALFICSYLVPVLLAFAKVALLLFLAASLVEFIILFASPKGIQANRIVAERLSNGDDNEIRIVLESYYRSSMTVDVIDEVPHQFQVRDTRFTQILTQGETKSFTYQLRPVKRGEYNFGAINVFVHAPLGLLKRRLKHEADKIVPVYPSYIQMRKYELLAISNRLTETGIKKIRRIGHNLEFEQIKKYVAGDDIRTINWKATARKNDLMVNHYQDERMQQVYCLIDKGRVMQMPFKGLSLLDYAINSSLVISNIAIKKSDKAGLITFQDKINTFLPASRVNNQMAAIQQVLYNQKTAYRESDFSDLYTGIRRRVNQRSLLILYTNFETLFGLQRQLTYLINLAKRHLLVVVFFENTEMKKLVEEPVQELESVYQKAVAEKFMYEKRLIVKELQKHGIQSILTPPEKLTINTINKYLELKARNLI